MKHIGNCTKTNRLTAGDLLEPMPQAGAGVHNWLFRAALKLHRFMTSDQVVALLRDRVAHCGRRVPQREITAAVRDSKRCADQKGSLRSPVSFRGDCISGVSLLARRQETGDWLPGAEAKPKVDPELRESIVRSPSAYRLADLWELSPVRLNGEEPLAEWIIDLFFPGNPLLCCGSGPARFDTRRREEWRGQLNNLGLIVPSPMSSVTGLTQDGRPSRHTLANTGPRRFLVCEFDQGDCDEHAALLWHLEKSAPLACAVHSGGKSLHGWFYVQHFNEEQSQRFFWHAVRLGGDPATWTRSQFVRLPDGQRDNGKRQTVFYLNPETLTKK